MEINLKKFESLDPGKQERIINSAFREFARNGYNKASTNEITKSAGIAKGSLFTYFKSKRKLYFFLVNYMKEINQRIIEEIDLAQTDLFQRLKAIGMIKFRVMKQYPSGFNFLKSVANENSEDIKPQIAIIQKEIIAHGLGKIYENIDWSKFRDDINIEKTVNILNWVMLGFSEQQVKYLHSFENLDEGILKESDEYFDIMKRCFYK